MLSQEEKKKIADIWQSYVESDRVVRDNQGRIIDNINGQRLQAIPDVRELISDFLVDRLNLREFKTALDGYNKRNNLWGFRAIKGQLFFNQLVTSSESNLQELIDILKACITEPTSLDDALTKIEKLETYVRRIFSKAPDKRKVPNPSSVGYFLSYFWQIHDPIKWPLMYSSLLKAFAAVGIWTEAGSELEAYKRFFAINEEIKETLGVVAGQSVSNWDAEHAFWNYAGSGYQPAPSKPKNSGDPSSIPVTLQPEVVAEFDIRDYLIPRVVGLKELGASEDRSKGSEFEKLVGEVFSLLDFQVEQMGQGTGRNPDVIITHREENTAFLIDAKAYASGYNLGLDDRAIREYISLRCPGLRKEGYTKIGFIIVSNLFKSDLEEFANDITWNSDIKRFILITSDALLHLLAYKNKGKLTTSDIVKSLVSLSNPIKAENIIDRFKDV